MIHKFSDPNNELADLPLNQTSPDLRQQIHRDNPLGQRDSRQMHDLALATRLAREAVYVGGNWVDLYHRTDNSDADRVWDEDPNPTYYQPVQLKAFYSPKQIEVAVTQSGPDAPVKLEIAFSFADLLSRFGGRLVRTGDVVHLQYKTVGQASPTFFSIVNASEQGNYWFNWLYVMCVVESTHADITVLPESDCIRKIADYHEE